MIRGCAVKITAGLYEGYGGYWWGEFYDWISASEKIICGFIELPHLPVESNMRVIPVTDFEVISDAVHSWLAAKE